MSTAINHSNEQKAATAFSLQSAIFDELYGKDGIIEYKRQRVRAHLLRQLPPGAQLLELNCGTGEDAIFLANRGFRIHATDISEGMLNKAAEKISEQGIQGIGLERCSFTQLEQLQKRGPYDAVFSNFGGLNCTGALDQVLISLDALVRPGGTVTLVIISRFCLWETLLALRGRFRTAFRRLWSRAGRQARVEGSAFTCWYYAPQYVRRHMPACFELQSVEGLCTIVPPSYIEHFADRHTRAFRLLRRWEDRLKDRWPWKYMGDYFIISFRKRSGA